MINIKECINREFLEWMVKRMLELQKIDEDLQKAMDDFTKVFASDSYSPILENTNCEHFINTMEQLVPGVGIEDDLSYYIYEVPMMKDVEYHVTYETGEKFNFDTPKGFIDFLEFKLKLKND